MKRKRGNKKGKKKGKPPVAVAINEPVVNLVSLSKEEENSGAEEYDNNNDDNNNHAEYESVMEVNTPSSTGTEQPLNLASINPDGSIDKTTGKSVGRVKVKIKTSKTLESQSDTDKSSPQLGLEMQGGVNDKMEDDSGNSQAEVKMCVSGNVSKKPGSIKIKSSKVVGSGLSVEKSGGNAVVAQDKILEQNEPKTPQQLSHYDKQELDSALTVIKKVMKMDAAEPFNVPVNPEALGIPDYFDVIDTPMDFGTICSSLEKGDKYMNSEDVYKDVQYIWDNCYKYNNKGDYILDLMRRVKKNFMKYWTGAGLYTEQSRGSNGAEGVQGEDVAVSTQGVVKTYQSKKTKKRHGRRHKADCLCAICVLKRRRREREESARLAKGQIGVTDNKFVEESKQEDSSLIGSPCGEDSSSNMGESLDPDADFEVEGKGQEVKMEVTERQYSPAEEKREEEVEDGEDEEGEEEDEEENELEILKKGKTETLELPQFSDRSGEEPIRQSQPGTAERPGALVQTHSQKGHASLLHEETVAFYQNKLKLQELQERKKKAKMFKESHVENPMLLSLCETLFPNNDRSVWSGPHSLVQRRGSAHRSSIHAAIETLMK